MHGSVEPVKMSAAKQLEDAVFYAALNVEDPAQRKVFLDQACAGQDGLRTMVEEMLCAHSAAERFFVQGSSALQVAAEDVQANALASVAEAANHSLPPASEELGLHIGRYTLLQKIGEGGCGAVYMASQDEPVRRRVALKLIKLGMDTKNVIGRFEAERQALALMDHPNIARVLDAGATESGRPYFVMELVRGVKITEFCDQNNLDIRQRLDLFIQVCHAIQHAHQKGVIHRDIKPSNILVTLHDGVPVPKVIDFGIAKAIEGPLTDKPFFTAYEQFIGTPAYVSPEQAEMRGLDVDTRSDIYSLGVLLYELLTGRTPFDATQLMRSGLDVMRRTLREKEPQRPSAMLTTLQGEELKTTALHHRAEPPKLISLLRGDLDWIVMKALEKDRARRYETANALAMDVQRHINNEPVTARPPSRLYLFEKLVRRNKVLFSAGAAVAAALLVGLGASTWLYLKEKEALQREALLRQEAELKIKISQAAYLVAQARVDKADRLLGDISVAQPSLESESVFRALGWWHAVQGNWKQAADRFTTLLRINEKNDSWDTVTGDVINAGPALIELGDSARYEKFRQEMIARFAGTTNAVVAERVVKSSLLAVADKKTLAALAPLAEVAERSLDNSDGRNDDFLASWRCISVGLMEYRRGNWAQAAQYCRRCLANRQFNGPRVATAHAILAMALKELGQASSARSELAQSSEIIEAKFRGGIDVGNSPQGFWHDWFFARILLQEAAGHLEEPIQPANGESKAE
jgi:serine/threonine protein kinase